MANRPSEKYCYCPERYTKINTKILICFGKHLVQEVLNNTDGVKMPSPFGKVFIAGIRHGGRKLDVSSTMKYKKAIFYTNEESDGYFFKLVVKFYTIGINKHPFRLAKFYKIAPYKAIKLGIFEKVKAKMWHHWKRFNSVKDT